MILEKSLGAMAKAGSTNLVGVVNYAEAVTKKGFVFMDTPASIQSLRPRGRSPGGESFHCRLI
jgi:altronate hydrolase